MEVRKPVSRIDGDFPIASNSMPWSEAATARRQETKLTTEPISLSCGFGIQLCEILRTTEIDSLPKP